MQEFLNFLGYSSTSISFIRHKLTCIPKSSCRRQFVNQIQIRSGLRGFSHAKFIKKRFQGSVCAIAAQTENPHFQQAFGAIGVDAGIGFAQRLQCFSRIGILPCTLTMAGTMRVSTRWAIMRMTSMKSRCDSVRTSRRSESSSCAARRCLSVLYFSGRTFNARLQADKSPARGCSAVCL